MKTALFLAASLLGGVSVGSAAPNTAPAHPRHLHFARGATNLSVRGHLSGSLRRFYVLKTRGGQRLKIGARSAAGGAVVPLVMVTPPRGHYDGDKTATYSTRSTRAGDYKIEVAANLMASNGRSGPFILSISAR